MIVGTRFPDGKIAHFDVSTTSIKDARNQVRQEMIEMAGVHEFTPFLVSIPDCGRDLKPKVILHRVSGKDPLEGAMAIVKGEVATETVNASVEPVEGLVDQVDE